jgi:signal transduction histidine kinase
VQRSWFPLAFWSGALAVALALWFSLEQFHRLPPPGDALRVGEMQRLGWHAEAPQTLPRSGWRAVVLPEDWLHEGVSGTEVWYRTTIELDVPPNRLWAILLPGVNLAASVFFNGELIGASISLVEPLSQDWNRPLMFTIPNGHLRPGSNELHVRVISYPSGHGFFAPVFIGPDELLRPSYESRSFVQVQLSRFITVATAFMSLFLGLIWWLRPTETVYGWLSLSTLMWSGHSLKYHVSSIPVTSFEWAAFLFITAIGFSTAVSVFMLRFTDARRPWMEGMLLWHAMLAIIVIVALTLLGTDHMYTAAQAFVTLAILFAGANFLRMAIRIRDLREMDAYLVGAAVLIVLVVGMRDWILILGYMERSRGQYTQYAIPLLLGVLGVVLVNRFVQALRATERFTSELEATVLARTRELERKHAEVKALERDRALAEERERLMRDMHDGAGGHLVSSLALLKAKGIDDADISAALTGALTDLRLMIDSLDPVDDDLNSVLGMLRDRMQAPLEASGLTTDWQLERLPLVPELRPEHVLQILRILQEALTNVIRHAGASRVTVSAAYDRAGRTARICVRDDGRGIDGLRHGRGLANMRNRAQRLGGNVDIRSDTSGTSVCLSIPYSAPTPECSTTPPV